MALNAAQKLEIYELASRVYLYLDDENAEGFASLFTKDGVFVAPYGEFEGPAAIKNFMDDHIAAGKEDGVRHFLSNFVVDDHPDGARFRFYILKMNIAKGPSPIATAAGDWIVANTEDGWLLKRFELHIDPAMFDKA